MQSNTPTTRHSDELQKQHIATTLNNFIDNTHAVETLNWEWDQLLTSDVGSTGFDQIHRNARVSLSILLRHPGFAAIRRRRSIPETAIFLVDQNSRFYFSYQNIVGHDEKPATRFVSPHNITADVAHLSDFVQDLKLLGSAARSSGGWVTSGENILVGQWLRFHGLQLPGNENETRGLIDLLNFSTLPEAPEYGNYWELLDAPDGSPFKLDDKQRAIIAQVTETLTGGDESLTATFGGHLMLSSTSVDPLPVSVDYRIQRLLDTAVWSSEHAQDYIHALGWFPDTAGEAPIRRVVEQLLIAAMLLDLDPALDIASTHFAGFDLYAPDFLMRPPSAVRAQLEQHLIGELSLHPLFAPLVAQWVLGGMAPEYLFPHWPGAVKIGTPAWVIGTQAVHLVEALIPGVSRKMSYEHLLGFGQSAKAMPLLSSLQKHAAVDPVINWAVMNRLVSRNTDSFVSQASITYATSEYNRHLDKILSAAEKFSSPLPDRKQLALKELKSSVPECDPEELLVKHRGSGGGGGRKVSVLDLYMGDELHTRDWNRIRGNSIYESLPGLDALFPVQELYETAISDYFSGITEALASNIEVALSKVLPEDAGDLEYGALGIYALQTIEYRPESASGRPGVTVPAAELPGKTGRYGVIICTQYAHNRVACFELFPMRMECRYNRDLEPFLAPLVSGNYYDLDTRFADRKKLENVPIDIQAYQQNVDPRDTAKSRFYLRKIGELKAPTGEADPDYPTPFFRSPRKEALSKLIAEKNPYITESEIRQLGLHPTTRERAIAKTEAIFDVILNLIIPFKGCVEGLFSGDQKKQGAAIVDCVVDAAALAIVFAAVPAKIASATAKGASAATRLLSASRVLTSTTLGLFNPVSGLPQLIKGTGKLLGRSVSKLSASTLSVTRQARQQLRYLTGANSYDLLKALEHTGSAAQIRMKLDTVSHARTLFKSDSIQTTQEIVARLSEKNFTLPKGVTENELQHLTNNAVKTTALQSSQANSLQSLIGRTALEELTGAYIASHPIRLFDTKITARDYVETLDVLFGLESKKAHYMKGYQENVLKLDLGKAPYTDVLPDSIFNPLNYTDPTHRAAAWMLNGSSSSGNDFNNITSLLREYAGNGASLIDPGVIKEIHRRLVPEAVGRVRDAGLSTKYGSSPTGFSLLEQHLQKLDLTHPHLDKQLLAAVVGFQGFGDGNGRTASALYAIIQLRENRFTAMPPHVFSVLNGIF
ncbi:hypothetical protein [Pseudomonas sp. HS6]|uniref:hypothetical protein n=1 Tax=Pseudomonas sp. HS6 TaxID=2850559 RepID=UPI002018A388|nr:hypothetical protein [Pseudomonas sp. HS6]UQS17477.1 hypothetical protein JJN09_11650 [Pseudomonas sp. HS6]